MQFFCICIKYGQFNKLAACTRTLWVICTRLMLTQLYVECVSHLHPKTTGTLSAAQAFLQVILAPECWIGWRGRVRHEGISGEGKRRELLFPSIFLLGWMKCEEVKGSRWAELLCCCVTGRVLLWEGPGGGRRLCWLPNELETGSKRLNSSQE